MADQPKSMKSQEKSHLLNPLLDKIENPILIMDLLGHIIYQNRFATKFFGRNSDDGFDIIKPAIHHPSILELVNKNINNLQMGLPFREVYPVVDQKGNRIETTLQASLIKDDGEEYISLLFELPDKPEFHQLKVANKILTEVDKILGDEVNYEAMLRKLVEFIIPQLADICAIHVLQPNNSLDRVALAPSDLSNHLSIRNWLDEDLPNDDTEGLPSILELGKPILIPEVNQVRRAAKAGIKSYMILPLITHRRLRGAITFISINPSRSFNQELLELAQNLAINISIYLEKNRLYLESQKLKEGLEQRVAERTVELSEAVSQLKQSEHMIQTLFRISKKLNATLDVDMILDELAQEAIRLVDGESGFAGLRTDEGMQVKKYFHNGKAVTFEYTWPFGEGIPGWVLKYKVPYGTSDAQNDPLIRSELGINEKVRSIICTPILDSVGEVIGYFDIRNKMGADGFSINDQEMLLTLAPVASIAIQNAVAYQNRLKNVAELKESSKQLEELAARLEYTREEERMRISRELHDQLGQSLTALKFDLTTLTNQIKGIDDDLAHRAKDILIQLNTMIKTVRRISTELRPGMLDDLGLIASIEWQAGDFQKRTGIICRVNAPATEINLNREQSLALFRIFQEALTNVARYAEAKNVEINLFDREDNLHFEFHDDGRGIKREEISGGQSLGLLGMRERVEHIGVSFEIVGKPNQGTTIIVTIPLNKT